MNMREDFFEGLKMESDMNKMFEQLHMDSLDKAIKDQELKKRLIPTYPPGCKRIILSDDIFPALAKDNVSLISEDIAAFTNTGILTKNDIEHGPYDLIVLATGFKTTEFLHSISIKGRNGRDLRDVWRNGAEAYLGITVESLPNFGMLYGVNSNLGHNSIILLIEEQARYIVDLIRPIESGLIKSVEIKKEAVLAFNHELQTRLQNLTFASDSCQSWYKDAKTGRITNNWCGDVREYQARTSRVHWNDYDVKNGRAYVDSTSLEKGERPSTWSHWATLAVTIAAAGAFIYRPTRFK